MATKQSNISGIVPPPNSPTSPNQEEKGNPTFPTSAATPSANPTQSSATRADKRELETSTLATDDKKIKIEDDRIIQVYSNELLEKIQIVIERKKKCIYLDLPTCFYVIKRLVGAMHKDPAIRVQLSTLCMQMYQEFPFFASRMLYEEAEEHGFKESKLAYRSENPAIWVSPFNDDYYVFIKQEGVSVNFKLDDSWDVIHKIVKTAFPLVVGDEGRYIAFFQCFERFLSEILYACEDLHMANTYERLKGEMMKLGFNEVREGATPKFYVMNNWVSVSIPDFNQAKDEDEEDEERKVLGCEIQTDILLNPWLLNLYEHPLQNYGIISPAEMCAKKRMLREIRKRTKPTKPKFDIMMMAEYYETSGWTPVAEDDWADIAEKEGVYVFGIDETGQIWQKFRTEANQDVKIWEGVLEELCKPKDGEEEPNDKTITDGKDAKPCMHPHHQFRGNWPAKYFELRKWKRVAKYGDFPPNTNGKRKNAWLVDSEGQTWMKDYVDLGEVTVPVFFVPEKCNCGQLTKM